MNEAKQKLYTTTTRIKHVRVRDMCHCQDSRDRQQNDIIHISMDRAARRSTLVWGIVRFIIIVGILLQINEPVIADSKLLTTFRFFITVLSRTTPRHAKY